jgi:hypothetical protein
MFNCMGESCWCSPNQVALSIHIHERHIRAPGPIFMLNGRCDLSAKESSSSSSLCRKKSTEIQEQWLFVYLATGQKNSILPIERLFGCCCCNALCAHDFWSLLLLLASWLVFPTAIISFSRFSTPRLHPVKHQPAAASRCNYVVARKSWIKDGHES